jgi:hypothetical protein
VGLRVSGGVRVYGVLNSKGNKKTKQEKQKEFLIRLFNRCETIRQHTIGTAIGCLQVGMTYLHY